MFLFTLSIFRKGEWPNVELCRPLGMIYLVAVNLCLAERCYQLPEVPGKTFEMLWPEEANTTKDLAYLCSLKSPAHGSSEEVESMTASQIVTMMTERDTCKADSQKPTALDHSRFNLSGQHSSEQ